MLKSKYMPRATILHFLPYNNNRLALYTVGIPKRLGHPSSFPVISVPINEHKEAVSMCLNNSNHYHGSLVFSTHKIEDGGKPARQKMKF